MGATCGGWREKGASVYTYAGSAKESAMAVGVAPGKGSLVMNKVELRKAIAELNERLGLVFDGPVVHGEARARIAACGVRPEDNEFSREIIRTRDEKLGEV